LNELISFLFICSVIIVDRILPMFITFTLGYQIICYTYLNPIILDCMASCISYDVHIFPNNINKYNEYCTFLLIYLQ